MTANTFVSFLPFTGESTNAFKIARITCRDQCEVLGTVNHLYVSIYNDGTTNTTGVSFQMTILIGKDECKENTEKYC